MKYISRSIGLMQAVAVLFATTVMGLVLSAILLSYSLNQQRGDAFALTLGLLDLTEGGAVRAAWTLDSSLATDVVASALATTSVQKASITDEQGNVLAVAEKALPRLGTAAAWFIDAFFRDALEKRRNLFARQSGGLSPVGTLSVALAPNHIVDSFFRVASTIVVASLVQAFLISLILLWLSSRLVTSPLRRIARTIADIDPQRPDEMFIPVPVRHRSNELGHLLDHTNEMLERLASSQDQLRHLATRDPLTGLPNRALIRDRLCGALSRADRSNCRVAVLFLDLDRFKTINDSLGHEVGDELLIAVARTITHTIRANDSAGRLGGDEFLVILEDINEIGDAALTVKRIHHGLSNTFIVQSQQLRTSASIGIAFYPDDGKDADTLMRHADLAMYQAKGSGSRWNFFADKMSEKVATRLRLETALGGALNRDELLLHFQPKFNAQSGELAGCEALLRWQQAGTLLKAHDFISVAEDAGAILEIGDWVLEEAGRQIQDWAARFWHLPVSVNVSARQLRDENFADRILASARRHASAGELLELEITETALMEDLGRSAQLLTQLREAGIAISIDDFGTGYSSLSYLTRLPINALKIDKSFVSGPRRSRVVLSTIIAMAKALQIQTVAEGVETEEQRTMMVTEGCDLLQGYLFGRPVPPAEFERRYLIPAETTSRRACETEE